MTLGIKDLKNVSLPAAWDGNELSRLQLRDGTTYESLVRDIDSALSMVNGGLNSGYLGRMLSLTADPTVEYRNGGTNGFESHTEQANPDSQGADTTGHMLPLLMKDRGLGWTADYFRQARRRNVDADIQSMIEDAVDIYEKTVWQQFFKMEEVTGKASGLGASGVSVPFADGGNGTIPFIPVPYPSRELNTFDATHDHFLRLNGITQANLETAVAHLWEHGVDGPYELIVARADIGSWQNTTNVTGFKPKANALIQYGGLNDLAQVEIEYYEGVVDTKYGTCKIYANSRIPTGYWAVTKSYGQTDQRNPLRVRYDETFGFGVKLVVGTINLYPFAGAIGQFEFGAGTGESRVGAVLVENDTSGDYATPTIS